MVATNIEKRAACVSGFDDTALDRNDNVFGYPRAFYKPADFDTDIAAQDIILVNEMIGGIAVAGDTAERPEVRRILTEEFAMCDSVSGAVQNVDAVPPTVGGLISPEINRCNDNARMAGAFPVLAVDADRRTGNGSAASGDNAEIVDRQNVLVASATVEENEIEAAVIAVENKSACIAPVS